jgi:hypothetical protein
MTLSTPQLLATGLVQDPGAVPLVIGVAGHRDPRSEDLPVLRERFRSLITSLMERLPHTPLLVLNGLGAGMDSEAAEVFLELVGEQRLQLTPAPHHQLVAVLPKPRELYLAEDFPLDGSAEKAAKRQRLERLLIACDAVLDGSNCPELALPEPPDDQPHDLWDPRCYGRQSVFLVRHCYLLVAFSNGLDSGKVGGTSQTVAMQRGEVYPLFLHVDEVIAAREPGVVVEITTPRLSDPARSCPVGQVHYWGENLDGGRIDPMALAGLELPDLPSLLQHSRILGRLEDINIALPAYPPAPVHDSGVQTSLWRLADARATREKGRYLKLCRAVMLTSVLVSLGTSQQEWQAVGLLVVLAAVLIFPKLQRSPKLAFIQWRCLAESLMVTDRWCALQVKGDTADLFHSQTNQNFAWIRTVLRARRLQLMAQHLRSDLCPPMPEAIEASRHWIHAQERWLDEAIKRQQCWDCRYLYGGTLSFLLALALGFVYWIAGENTVNELLPELLIAIAVACFGYRELMGYSDTNARYGRSRAQFARARQAQALARPDPHDPAMLQVRQRLVVEAVGREKLDELNDWVGDQLQRMYSPAG